MQKATKFVSKAALLCLFASTAASAIAQSASSKDSIITVEQLLKLDNAQARALAAKDLVASGLTSGASPDAAKKASTGKPAPVRATFSVSKIVGVGTTLSADVAYNNQSFNDVAVGSRVGPCNVTAIAGQCVSLSAAATQLNSPQAKGGTSSSTSTSSKKQKTEKSAAALMCPSACWTGVPAFDPSKNFSPEGAPGSVAQAISGPLPPSGVPGPMSMQMKAPGSAK